MTDNESMRFSAANRASLDKVLEDEDLIRLSVFYYLRGCGFECLEGLDETATVLGSTSITHHPPRSAQLKLLFNDARTSVVLALQRHWNNEYYRRRLASEEHYRILQPYLSEQFRRLMVRASHLVGFRCAASPEPKLAARYQDEIDRLEQEWRTSGVI